MAGLQELRKRLRSVQATGQLSAAMSTAATAKYAKVSRVRGDFDAYAQECERMLALLGSRGLPRAAAETAKRDCLVILGGNRGLCGGFNLELLRFLEDMLSGAETPPLLICCGKIASAWLREKGLAAEEILLPDVPAYSDVRALSDRLRQVYDRGEAERVIALYQHFQNMMVQKPQTAQLLPPPESPAASGEDSVLYLPDRESISAQLAEQCFHARVFSLALENAAGAQAATVLAMRSASDNAEKSAAELQITINRRRQAEVTSGVIETASGAFQ